MLLITATKNSPNSIKFEFDGPEAHAQAAIKVLGANAKSPLTKGGVSELIVDVSPALIDAIALCCSIDAIDGEPFLPIFLPNF